MDIDKPDQHMLDIIDLSSKASDLSDMDNFEDAHSDTIPSSMSASHQTGLIGPTDEFTVAVPISHGHFKQPYNRVKGLERVAHVLHQFPSGWLHVELAGHTRIYIRPAELEHLPNGHEAFVKFLMNLAGPWTQRQPFRRAIRHVNSVQPESISESESDTEDIPLVKRIKEQSLALQSVHKFHKRHLSGPTSKIARDVSKTSPQIKIRIPTTRTVLEKTTDNEYSSDDVPLQRRSLRTQGARPNYNVSQIYQTSAEQGLFSSDDQNEQSEGDTSSDDSLTSRNGKPLHKHHSQHETTTTEELISDPTLPVVRRTMQGRIIKPRILEPIVELPKEKIVPEKADKTHLYFPRVDLGSEFSRRHSQQCSYCYNGSSDSDKGPLLFCQGCSFSYHEDCSRVLSAKYGKHNIVLATEHLSVLQCRHCIGMKGTQYDYGGELCFVCQKPGPNSEKFKPFYTPHPRISVVSLENADKEDNDDLLNTIDDIYEEKITDSRLFNADNVMFRCLRCYRAAHFNHLPRLKLDDGSEDSSDIVSQYAHFICLTCGKYQRKIENIIAWRPVLKPGQTPDVHATLDRTAPQDREYLVKFEQDSYFGAVWVPGSWFLSLIHPKQYGAFQKKFPEPVYETSSAISEDHYRVDIIMEVIYKNNMSRESMGFTSQKAELNAISKIEKIYAKWKALSYAELYWEIPPKESEAGRYEDFERAYKTYVLGFYTNLPTNYKGIKVARQTRFNTLKLTRQPRSLQGGTLMSYQLDGVNWLYYNWILGKSCILADDMGLGKTIQIISFCSVLFHQHGVWPLLIIAPQSTIPNWLREFEKWAPDMRTVGLYGWAEHRAIQKNYLLNRNGGPKNLNCHVIVTSFNTAVEESTYLSKYSWQLMVVDEGQKLKSDKNVIYKTLLDIGAAHKVLLTGTPLQNNIRELFNLLQFLSPDMNAEELESQYAQMNGTNVQELHDLLRPYFLRRTKAEVLKDMIPNKTEIIVPITMSSLQKMLYKSILAKNPDLLRAIVSTTGHISQKASKSNLNNLLLQLRKCLCHPFLYNESMDEQPTDSEEALKKLTSACGKLQFLSVMLPKLIDSKHRILIFSQFLGMLDIFEDFLYWMNIKYVRLDGSVSSQERQKRIDRFNAPDSDISVFILSTRAGGVGVNLATADVVIIYDPDFNPHQDLQALSRAHRLGQKNKVLVFNLVTRNSAEEKILQIGQRKLLLDHLVIENMHGTKAEQSDLLSVMHSGAQALFKGDEKEIKYDSAAIDKLIEEAQNIEETDEKESSEQDNKFSFARVWENETGELATDTGESEPEASAADPEFWDKILQEREAQLLAEKQSKALELGRGKRTREQLTQLTSDGVDGDDRGQEMKRRKRSASVLSDTSFELSSEHEAAEVDMEPREALDPDDVSVIAAQGAPTVQTPIGVLTTPQDSAAPVAKKRRRRRLQNSAGDEQFGQFQALPPNSTSTKEGSTSQHMGTSADGTVQPQPGGPVYMQQSTPQVHSALQHENVNYPPAPPTGVPPQFVQQRTVFHPHQQPPGSTMAPSAPSQMQFAELQKIRADVIEQLGWKSLIPNTKPMCDGSHSQHPPGQCPLRKFEASVCPLCGLKHLWGFSVCPRLQELREVDYLIQALQRSPEPLALRRLAFRALQMKRDLLVSHSIVEAQSGLTYHKPIDAEKLAPVPATAQMFAAAGVTTTQVPPASIPRTMTTAQPSALVPGQTAEVQAPATVLQPMTAVQATTNAAVTQMAAQHSTPQAREWRTPTPTTLPQPIPPAPPTQGAANMASRFKQ
ncbi:uncharacterized protein V1518DRAFT_63813 [Limtongia smithiae]|uniref:uncharacterized protein n=1 Tax=Limtongia smithiae TaxID=1125753 RepID=UPI0034CDFA52